MSPTASEYGIWFLVASSVLGMIANAALIYTSFRTQRRSVSLQDNFATVTDLKRVERRLDVIEEHHESIAKRAEALRLEIKNDVTELHEKVNAVANQVSGVGKQCEMLNQQLVQLASQFNRLLERAKS
ncbi:MAG: hypothetical protein ABS95_01750 [Verrucomicrobia bacterium SCN 57-15]|nr:MAG: hypothetical protein ABS95_01750 [Verrucomicrobia bacterium SCN 57-15]